MNCSQTSCKSLILKKVRFTHKTKKTTIDGNFCDMTRAISPPKLKASDRVSLEDVPAIYDIHEHVQVTWTYSSQSIIEKQTGQLCLKSRQAHDNGRLSELKQSHNETTVWKKGI